MYWTLYLSTYGCVAAWLSCPAPNYFGGGFRCRSTAPLYAAEWSDQRKAQLAAVFPGSAGVACVCGMCVWGLFQSSCEPMRKSLPAIKLLLPAHLPSLRTSAFPSPAIHAPTSTSLLKHTSMDLDRSLDEIAAARQPVGEPNCIGRIWFLGVRGGGCSLTRGYRTKETTIATAAAGETEVDDERDKNIPAMA